MQRTAHPARSPLLAAVGALVGCGGGAAGPAPDETRTAQGVQPAPAPAPKGPPVRAVLASLSGEVSVKRAAGDAWVTASERMDLFENDKVRTARGAGAEIRFVSGSVLAVGEDALLGIAETRPAPGQDPTDVTVLKGRIDAELADPTSQSLTVTTPSATVRAGREIVFQ